METDPKRIEFWTPANLEAQFRSAVTVPVEGKIETWREEDGGILSTQEFMAVDLQLSRADFGPGGTPSLGKELNDEWLSTTHFVFAVIDRPGVDLEMRSIQFGTAEVCSFPVRR